MRIFHHGDRSRHSNGSSRDNFRNNNFRNNNLRNNNFRHNNFRHNSLAVLSRSRARFYGCFFGRLCSSFCRCFCRRARRSRRGGSNRGYYLLLCHKNL